jgi:predicted SprT family Zn-dependent metalloprotease
LVNNDCGPGMKYCQQRFFLVARKRWSSANSALRAVKLSRLSSLKSPVFKRSTKLSRTNVFSSDNEEDEEDKEIQRQIPVPGLQKSSEIIDLTNFATTSLPINVVSPIRNNSRTKKIYTKSTTPAQWKKKRDIVLKSSFAEFNSKVFNNALDKNMKIEWSTRLRKTAGLTYMKSSKNKSIPSSARIELATKVLTDEQRLRATLLHEMCHAAAWIINGVSKPPHGPQFKYYGAKASRMFPELKVSTCHNYKIAYKYIYRCINYRSGKCAWEMGRHSRSVDLLKQVCGRCRGHILEPLVVNQHGVPEKAKKLTQYQIFSQKQFKTMVTDGSGRGLSFGEKNKEIARLWATEKENTGTTV